MRHLHYLLASLWSLTSLCYGYTVLTILSSLTLVISSNAQTDIWVDDGETPPYLIPMTNNMVRVDGIIDESLWDNALELHLDYEVRPGENIPPPVRTDVLLTYNDTYLLVAFRVHDPNPEEIEAHYSDRDDFWRDDWVALILDTFNDSRRYYDFFSNPYGVQGDFIENAVGPGSAWDGIWDSAARIADPGWNVEMAIPFSTLRFQRRDEAQVWRIDAVRSYPRSVRHHIGLFPRDRSNNCYMCQAERIIGFAGVTPGKNIELTPTISSVFSQEREDQDNYSGRFIDSEKNTETGMTMTWGLTPNLTLAATINPDFSQVEADARQLDVNTNNALYYSERRPFFLEGADYYMSRSRIVHTRMLADPSWGIKLTGKEGDGAIGVFLVQDEQTTFLFPGSQGSDTETLSMKSLGGVARYRHDVGKSSTMGITLLNREGSGYYNRAAGFDGDLRITKKDRVQYQLLGTLTRYPEELLTDNEYDQPEGSFGGGGYDLRFNHETRNNYFFLEHENVGDHLRDDLGFLTDVGYANVDAGLGHVWFRDSDHWWNRANWGGSYEYKEERGGIPLERTISSWFNISTVYDGRGELFVNYGDRFYNGQTFTYGFLWYSYNFHPVPSVRLELSGVVGEGIDYDNTRKGSRWNLEPEIEFSLGKHLLVELDHTFEQFYVSGDHLYTGSILNLRTVYQFNRRSFLRVILQDLDYRFTPSMYEDYQDPQERALFSQVLFSYKINPQTVFYLGYSDNYFGDQDIALTQTDRTLFGKIGYAWVP